MKLDEIETSPRGTLGIEVKANNKNQNKKQTQHQHKTPQKNKQKHRQQGTQGNQNGGWRLGETGETTRSPQKLNSLL